MSSDELFVASLDVLATEPCTRIIVAANFMCIETFVVSHKISDQDQDNVNDDRINYAVFLLEHILFSLLHSLKSFYLLEII